MERNPWQRLKSCALPEPAEARILRSQARELLLTGAQPSLAYLCCTLGPGRTRTPPPPHARGSFIRTPVQAVEAALSAAAERPN